MIKKYNPMGYEKAPRYLGEEKLMIKHDLNGKNAVAPPAGDNFFAPQFQSTHKLDFEVSPSYLGLRFRVGTCNGLYKVMPNMYCIIGIYNGERNNGHLQDVFDWFENSCKRDNYNLTVVEIRNRRFHDHLVNKRGFVNLDLKGENVIKVFNIPAYVNLLENGNEILIAKTLKCK